MKKWHNGAIAKDEPLKTSNGHSKPKAKKSGGKRVVVLDPGHGGIDTGAIGRNGSKDYPTLRSR
ncbi:N-acetylmuramoyl-L-alanine amidase AmiA [Escherichia coli 180200]|nr:N-acetylmuramoyl-L-alanine amidase AmiA [Escherichia coli 180200]